MVKHILVADDRLPARELLRAVLSNAGYHVTEASDGDGVIRQATARPPDLILLDIQMPGRDGFSICRELRSDSRFASVPILAMTAGLMRGERECALQAGFSGFLAKPISIATLRMTVADLLGESAHHGGAGSGA